MACGLSAVQPTAGNDIVNFQGLRSAPLCARAEADSAPLTQDAVQLGAVAVYHPVHQRAQLGERRRGTYPIPCHVRPCLFCVWASIFVCSLARARRHPGAWAPLRSPALRQIWRHFCQALIWCFFIFGVFTGAPPCVRRSMHASHLLRS